MTNFITRLEEQSELNKKFLEANLHAERVIASQENLVEVNDDRRIVRNEELGEVDADEEV